MQQITQLSLFVENRPGALSEVCNVLKQSSINIHALSLADTQQFGILRLLVSDADAGKEALESAGFVVKRNKVLAISVPDCAGGLAGVLEKIDNYKLSVEYMYAFTFGRAERAVIVFRFGDQEDAADKLAAEKLDFVTQEMLANA